MAYCGLGHWLDSPHGGLIRADHLVNVNYHPDGNQWVVEGQTVGGQTVTLLRLDDEDKADELYQAVRRYLEDPDEAEECVVHVEDLPAYYKEE